jgi:hypothetical protein
MTPIIMAMLIRAKRAGLETRLRRAAFNAG